MHRFFCLCLSNQPQYFTKNDTAHLCTWNQLNVERQIRLWREAQGHNNSELANNFCRFFCLTTSLTRRPPEIKSIFGSDWSSWPPAALSTTWKGHCSWKLELKKDTVCFFHMRSYSQIGFSVEHKTCDILAAELLRLMRFNNDKVSANTAKCQPQCYEKSDGSQDFQS